MKIADATFAIIDTEATRREAADPENEIVEVAVAGVTDLDVEVFAYESLVRPTRPIPPASSAIHHLTDEDVADAPTREQVDATLLEVIPLDAIPVAFNAEYDRTVLASQLNGLAGREFLCPLRLAHHLFPDEPEYKLQTLRYRFGHRDIGYTGAPHRAMYDVATLRKVFASLLDAYRAFARERCAGDDDRLAKSEEVETLLAFVRRPYLILKMPFGKYEGKAMERVPQDYWEWALSPRGLTDMSPDLRWNIERVTRGKVLA